MIQALKRQRALAVELCRHVRLTPVAHSLLRADLSPRAYFERLMEHEQWSTAIRFLPHALSTRSAVWWGALCLWHVSRKESASPASLPACGRLASRLILRPTVRAPFSATPPGPEDLAAAALDAAVTWVIDPSDANRRQAEAAGRAAGKKTAAGCLAFAAFWSGGNMNRTDRHEVLPPPYLTAKMVGASVLLAATIREPMKFRSHYLDFLALGRDVASGANRWSGTSRQRTETPPTATENVTASYHACSGVDQA